MTGITERAVMPRQGHQRDRCKGIPMKLMMPLMLTAPTLIQGGLAMRARRAPEDIRTRQLKVGIIFNVCYLIAVGVLSLLLALD